MDGGLVGIVDVDEDGMTPCPICRTPVRVLTDTPQRRLAYPPMTISSALEDLALVGPVLLAFLGLVHAVLWYVFGVDVVAWGGISIVGFRVPYFYFLWPILLITIGILEFIEHLKKRTL